MYQYHCLNPIAAIGLNNFTADYAKTEDAAHILIHRLVKCDRLLVIAGVLVRCGQSAKSHDRVDMLRAEQPLAILVHLLKKGKCPLPLTVLAERCCKIG